MKITNKETAISHLKAQIQIAERLENRAKAAGMPESEYPLDWSYLPNSRGLSSDTDWKRIAFMAESLAVACDIMRAKLYGKCERCRRPWPESGYFVQCPSCGGSLKAPSWKVLRFLKDQGEEDAKAGKPFNRELINQSEVAIGVSFDATKQCEMAYMKGWQDGMRVKQDLLIRQES